MKVTNQHGVVFVPFQAYVTGFLCNYFMVFLTCDQASLFFPAAEKNSGRLIAGYYDGFLDVTDIQDLSIWAVINKHMFTTCSLTKPKTLEVKNNDTFYEKPILRIVFQ